MTVDDWVNYIVGELNNPQAECRDRLPPELLSEAEAADEVQDDSSQHENDNLICCETP